jgi:hypothetical protein
MLELATELPWPTARLDCVRGGFGDASGTGSARGDGTVGVARDGGGTSVIDVSTATGLGAAASTACAGLAVEDTASAGSVVATAVELGPTAALGAPPGTVTGDRTSLAVNASCAAALGTTGRMLGGGGRRLGVLLCALGGMGRMLGGGGRERPRTGGGGGVPGGRESGVVVPAAGRGGSDTGRGACATGFGGTTDTGASPVVMARFSLSLAVPCSSPIGSPQAARSPA